MEFPSGNNWCQGQRCIGWMHGYVGDAPLRIRLYCRLRLAQRGRIEDYKWALDTFVYNEMTDWVSADGEYGDFKVALESDESRSALRELGYSRGGLQLDGDWQEWDECVRCGYESPVAEQRLAKATCSSCALAGTQDPGDIEREGDKEPTFDENVECYAREQGWRLTCRGATDCDGTCWKGDPQQFQQGRLF